MSLTPSHIVLEFPPAFLAFTRECEVFCVAGCCGLDAFSFDEETLGAVIQRLGTETAEEACKAGLEFANAHRAEKAECWSDQDDFNHRWTNGEDFDAWTKNLVSCIRKKIQNGPSGSETVAV